MFTPIETMPSSELNFRHSRCHALLQRFAPQAGGLLVFSRVNIYYLTGSMPNGVLWFPAVGEPVLLARKGEERARMESPLQHIYSFKSFGDIERLCKDAGSPLTSCIAAEMGALPWSLAALLQSKNKNIHYIEGDSVLARCRSVKSAWEYNKMKLCGTRHYHCMSELLPQRIHAGMSEQKISHIIWNLFFEHGHGGLMRMQNFGEEIFLGHISTGNNSNYPGCFNGPLGVKGEHPSMPLMGCADSIWQDKTGLAIDVNFCLEGYSTDKAQNYWAGSAESIPSIARKAHETCLKIQERAASCLKEGSIPSQIWLEAQQFAEKAGFADGFQGLNGNKVRFLGHGIGLTVDEFPPLAARFDEPLEDHMVIALEPKIAIAGLGMFGTENTFGVTPDGGKSLTGDTYDIICIE